MNLLNEFELPILHSLHDAVQTGFGDMFFPIITKLGNAGIFWIILAVILLCFKRTRKAGFAMSMSLILGLLITNVMIKPLVARIRPYIVDPSIVLLIPPESDFSFPSGHTSTSFECAFALFAYHKKAGVAAIILAAVIAFSRLYLMVHYPTDVLAGALLGLGIALLGCKTANLIYSKAKK